jgi:hypothetical protein
VGAAYDPGMMRQRIASVALALSLLAPTAAAQPEGEIEVEDLPEEEKKAVDTEARAEGEYGGVRPGQGARVPLKRPKNGTLAWVGFTAEGGVARIFLQAPNEFGFSQRIEGKTIVVHLEGLRYLGRQVRRPLYTQHFDSPVRKITVKKVGARKARKGRPGRKAGIEVRIQVASAADAREAAARSAMEADGYFYLYLDVGPSAAQPDATP